MSDRRDRRERRDRHFLDANGMVACNPRDREAAHRAEVEGIATTTETDVTCSKCQALLRQSEMSEVVRYLCVARLDGRDRYFLWESGGDAPDRVILDDAGIVIEFPSEQAARAARSGSGDQSTETTVYDLDALRTWCTSSDEIRDCVPLLDAWNLFGDLPRKGALYAEADARMTPVYDKLFHGCNLPAMTPEGEHYVPDWSASETAALKQLLMLGIAELRARFR